MKKLLFILLLVPFLANATVWHFANAGNDVTGNGTQATPYATLAKLKTLSLTSGDSVVFNRGDDFQGVLFFISNIHYGVYGTGADPKIDELFTLTGGTSLGNNIYEFYVPLVRQNCNLLVANGVNQRVGTYPDTGYLHYTTINSSGITDLSSLQYTVYNWAGATVGLRDEFYNIDTLHCVTQTSTSLTFATVPSIIGNRGAGFFFMNDPRTLTLTSRTFAWYNNWTKDSVQIYLPGGLGSNNIQVSIHDTAGVFNSVSNVTVNSLNFIGGNQMSLVFNNTSNITVTNCEVNNNGLNAIKANNCPNTSFNNDSLNWSNNCGGIITGTSSTHVNLINCYINHTGLLAGMGSTGAATAYTSWSNAMGFQTVSGNTILNSGYHGVYFSGDSDYIYNNNIDSFCLVKLDGGGIYSWDGNFVSYTYGRFVFNNTVHHGGTNTNGTVTNLADLSYAFYWDSHATSITSYNNTGDSCGSGGLMNHGSNMNFNHNNFFGNYYTQVYFAEANGIPLTGLFFKYNNIGSNQGYCAVISSFLNDLTSFGILDSNFYSNSTASVFHTISSVDPGTDRIFFGWQTIMSEPHSTMQVGIGVLTVNITSSIVLQSIIGINKELNGVAHNNSILLTAYTSKILLFIRIHPIRHTTITSMQKPSGSFSSTSHVVNRFINNKLMLLPPAITVTGSYTSFTTTVGTASPAQNLPYAGSNMQAMITFIPPTGYEVSTNSGVTYSSSAVSAVPSNYGIAGRIYTRLAAADAAGTYIGNVVATSTNAPSVNIPVTGTVTPLLAADSIRVQFDTTSAVNVAGWTHMTGDPHTHVITAIGGNSNTINVTSVSTSGSNWTGVPNCAAPGSGTATTTVWNYAQGVMAQGWFVFNGAGTGSYNAAFPNIKISGLSLSKTYTLQISGSINVSFTGTFTCVATYQVLSSVLQTSQTLQNLGNTTNSVTFSGLVPDGTGTISIYMYPVGSTLANISALILKSN